MPNTLQSIINTLTPFAPHFCRQRMWNKAQTLLIGAILTNGRRVVTAALRTMGLQEEATFNQYHHVLSRAVWSSLAMARTLLGLLLSTFFAPDEPLLLTVDETIERRWGAQDQRARHLLRCRAQQR